MWLNLLMLIASGDCGLLRFHCQSSFSIRMYINTYTCNIEKRKKYRQTIAAFIAGMVKTRYGGDVHHSPTPKAIIRMMNTLGVEVSC